MKALALFYSSPVGQKVLVKTPELQLKTAAIGAKVSQPHSPELNALLNAKRDELKAQAAARTPAAKSPAPASAIPAGTPASRPAKPTPKSSRDGSRSRPLDLLADAGAALLLRGVPALGERAQEAARQRSADRDAVGVRLDLEAPDDRDHLGRLLRDGQAPHRQHSAKRVGDQLAVLGVTREPGGRNSRASPCTVAWTARSVTDFIAPTRARAGSPSSPPSRLRGRNAGEVHERPGRRVPVDSREVPAEALPRGQAALAAALLARQRGRHGRFVSATIRVRLTSATAPSSPEPLLVAAGSSSPFGEDWRTAPREIRADAIRTRSKRPSKRTRPDSSRAGRAAGHRDHDRVDVLARREARLGQEARGVAVAREVVDVGEDLRAPGATRAARSSG